MKRLKTSVARALKKGQIKVGDVILVPLTVDRIAINWIRCGTEGDHMMLSTEDTILVPKPEPKPIDFSQEGRVLKHQTNGDIVKLTGYQKGATFSAVILNSGTYKGFASNNFKTSDPWQDITDTYQP